MVSKLPSVTGPSTTTSLNLLGMAKPAKGQSLWDIVEENRERLKACPGPHDFHPVVGEDPKFSRKLACRLCHGTLMRSEVDWYLKGLAHGRAEQR